MSPARKPPKAENFDEILQERLASKAPLAARMRPTTIDEIAGQRHLLGEGAPLRALIEADRLGSIILWGPPGTGKTTIARVIATVPRGGRSLFDVTLAGPAAVLIGGEGPGLPQPIVEAADQRVTIPMEGTVESLNSAVAAALIVYETRRQRHSELRVER